MLKPFSLFCETKLRKMEDYILEDYPILNYIFWVLIIFAISACLRCCICKRGKSRANQNQNQSQVQAPDTFWEVWPPEQGQEPSDQPAEVKIKKMIFLELNKTYKR